MRPSAIAAFFLPPALRYHPTHPRYTQCFVVANVTVPGLLLMLVGAGVMQYVHLSPWPFYLQTGLGVVLLLSLRLFGHYRLPMAVMAVSGLLVVYGFIRDSGMLFSINVNIVHMYLLAALLADKKWGWLAVPVCLGLLLYVYAHTSAPPAGAGPASLSNTPAYALALHSFITVFLGGIFAYGMYNEEQSRLKIQALQQQRISLLDEAVRQRTQQLDTMRQSLAADFHDETGNLLAAITRQAALLELQLHQQPAVLPIIRSILDNSTRLYTTSKDFLWDLHHQSDHPPALWQYLTGYGQQFYNQFDIDFSAENHAPTGLPGQLPPGAARHLLYIFKEAMTNVVKHANACEVVLTLAQDDHEATYTLRDNGRWLEPAPGLPHYGLLNMRRRALTQHFGFGLLHDASGTRIELRVPLHATFLGPA